MRGTGRAAEPTNNASSLCRFPATIRAGETRSPTQVECNNTKGISVYFAQQGFVSKLHLSLGTGAPGVIMDYDWSKRILCGIVGIAVWSYLGGFCVTAVLSAIFPSFHRMSNTLPASANVRAKQLVGWLVFDLLFVPFLCTSLERKAIIRVFVALDAYSIFPLRGIMIWAVSRAGGGGPLLSQGPLPSSDIG
ncbi:hypothetical protein SLS56_011664 [Neofusicoccum ribis]|uniref:Uncharacterized protein n=1 Tax=Neofusicoccum ribis TaxID=45134 RepID=A0ABR3SAZ6_9PEZI